MPAPPPHAESREGNGAPLPGLPELIAEAEILRDTLQEAAGRTARLVSALKQQRRQDRAVRAAVASLRHLQIDS